MAITNRDALPATWRLELEQLLLKGEHIVSVLAVDLGDGLRYSTGLVALTENRLLNWIPGAAGCATWPYMAGLVLHHHEHAGVGHLELVNAKKRLASWHVTPGRNWLAIRLAEQFSTLRDSHLNGLPPVCPLQDCCSRCNAAVAPAQDICPACARLAPVRTRPIRTLFRLWRFTGSYRGQLAIGFALMLGSTAAHMVAPYLTMPLVDQVLIPYQNGKPVDPLHVTMYIGVLLASAILAWGLGWGKTYVLARVAERIGATLRTATYEHLLDLSLEYIGGKRTGDLMARIGRDSDRICIFLSLHLLDYASDVLMIFMTGIILCAIDPWLAAATLLPLPLIAWLVHVVRGRINTWFQRIDRVWGQVTNVLADTIPGIRVVKAFAQEAREAQRFRRANGQNLAANDQLNRVWSLFSPSVSFLTELGLLVVWTAGIYRMSRGDMTVGVLTAFIGYGARFYNRLDSMSRMVAVVQHTASAAKRIFEILDQVSSVPEPASPVRLINVRGDLHLRDVSFRYGNRAVNQSISLHIKAGEMLGLVGHSGAGKSTLVNLICRFYDVSEGAIELDGVDIRALPLSEYRRNIGLVLQDPFLFFGTVAENLAYGKPNASRAEIIAAARAAHAHEFILRLPQGYDSMVGERGQGLSGGERQRISIARALLIDPPILILDEATSSVDSETETEIQKALDNLVRGRTTIVIAHRLSTLHNADRLVVLHRGRVVEEGPHEALMAQEGAYFRLYQAQVRSV